MSNYFHYTALGSFAHRVGVDMHGYIPTADCGPWELKYDHGSESLTPDYVQWWESEWPSLVADAVAATAAADAAIAEWQSENGINDDDDCTLVCGCQIQIDRSGGQGHCWRDVDRDDISGEVALEIEGEIIDGEVESCDDFIASNGQHYRW